MAVRRWLAISTFLGIALYLSIAFVTYDGLVAADGDGAFANAGGSVGFFLADQLLATFGAGSFAISFFLMFIGYALMTDRPLANVPIKVVGAVVFTVALATVIQALFPTAGYGRSVYPLGGVIGEYFASSLVSWFGGVGTFIILVLLLVASCILATDSLARDLGVEAWRGSRQLARAVAGLRAPRFAAFGGAGAGTVEADEEVAESPAPKRRARRSRKTEAVEAETVEETGLGGAAAEPDELDLLLGPLEVDEEEPLALEPMAEDEEEEDEEEAELDWEEEEDEDVDEEEFAEEDEEESEDDWDDEVEAALEDEEIEEEAPPPPIIHARREKPEDGVEILSLAREKHMAGREPYPLPPLTMLEESSEVDDEDRDAEIARKARTLEESLRTFRIEAKVVEITRGPTITVYEISLAAGTKVKSITTLADDISMALKAKTIRIVAPIPGKSTVGVEVPNDVQERVSLRELALSDKLKKKHHAIPLLLGKDAAGGAIIEDLAEMPHLLIAGQTGSGKSVAINTILMSLMLTKYPEEVRLILIDPKMVELQAFRAVPHLLTPVVTDMKKAPKILEWAVATMEERYELLAAVGAKNIKGFNELGEDEVRERLAEHFSDEEIEQRPVSLPYIVVVVDELADLMMTSAKEVESSICRLAQKSRAVGIHVILATQRPSVDVITGLIKSNMPTRISFRVASAIDSRTILDQKGAERLLGKGDMLVTDPRSATPTRGQGALVTDREIKSVIKYIKDVAKPAYSPVLTQVSTSGDSGGGSNRDRDPLYDDAVRAVLQSRRGSVSMLQRKLEIGYTRAARLVDFMAEDGIVGSFKGSKAREVTMTLEEWDAQSSAEA
ncbi:MAG: DNA translocase FtsK 4TM domain-containing protein [Planctomycetota bacterium]